MKVFRFDPETGTRGREPVAHVKRAGWTDARMTNYAGAEPRGFGERAEVTVHCDAGISDYDGAEPREISYRHATEWRAFCLGEWHVGCDDDGRPEYVWTWVVIPPANVDARYVAQEA